MSISQKPLRSESGFTSPGFNVDTTGNVNITGAFKINGVSISGSGGTLPTNYVYSNLTRVGILTQLTVHGNTTLSSGILSFTSTGSLTIAAGTPGTLDNIAVGSITPSTGTFTSLESDTFLTSSIAASGAISANSLTTSSLVSSTINATTLTLNNLTIATSFNANPTTTGALNNVTIGSITPSTGKFTALTITTNPTSSTDATTKKYVDTRVTAMSIALGS